MCVLQGSEQVSRQRVRPVGAVLCEPPTDVVLGAELGSSGRIVDFLFSFFEGRTGQALPM